MNNAGQHIADQPERLEEYLLGRLGKTASEAIEDHLRICPGCAEAVASERRLLAAIRRTGRDAIKERLRAHLAAEDSTLRISAPWPRIFAIAATVVILLGFGIAGRWLFLHYGTGDQGAEQAVRTIPNEPQVLTEDRQTQSEGLSPQAKKDRQAKSNVRDQEATRPENAASLKGGSSGAAGEPDQQPPLPALAEKSKKEIPSQAKDASEYSNLLAKTEGGVTNAPLRSADQMAGARAIPVGHKPVVVTMKLESDSGESRQVFGRADALLQQEPAASPVIHLTLFLPARDSSFRHLTPLTRWITDDSVLVSVGDTTAGFKVPLAR